MSKTRETSITMTLGIKFVKNEGHGHSPYGPGQGKTQGHQP